MNQKTPVFLILAHTHVDLLKRLIRVLSIYNGKIVLYFANKDSALRNEIHDFAKKHDVHLLKGQGPCYWASYRITQATLELLEYAFHNFKNQGHYHLLSAQCFPTQSAKNFHEFFSSNSEKSFFEFDPFPIPQWQGDYASALRVEYCHLNYYFDQKSLKLSHQLLRKINDLSLRAQKILGLKKATPALLKKFYGGSQWFSLNHKVVEWILKTLKENPSIQNYFKYSFVPDEVCLQTLFGNSPFYNSQNWSRNNLRFIDWNPSNNLELPRLLNAQEHSDGIKNPNVYFARKIDPHNNEVPEALIESLGISDASIET